MNLLKELVDLIQETGHIPAEFTKDLAHSRSYAAGFRHGASGGSAIDTTNMEKSIAAAYMAGYDAGKKTTEPTQVRTDVSSVAGPATVGEAKLVNLHVKVTKDNAAQGFNVSFKGRHIGHVYQDKAGWHAIDDASKKKWDHLKSKNEAIDKLLDHNNLVHTHNLDPKNIAEAIGDLDDPKPEVKKEPAKPASTSALADVANDSDDVGVDSSDSDDDDSSDDDTSGRRTADQLELGDEVVISGDVQFKGEPGKIVKFKDNGKKLVVVKLDDGGDHPFHSKDVTEREAKEKEVVATGDENKFYLAFYDHDEERPWIGLVSKEHGGKWHEKPYKGKPEYRWGHSYEAFLTPDDIRDTIGRSYPRSIEIEGPFFDASQAEEHVSHNWGKLAESLNEAKFFIFHNSRTDDEAYFANDAAAIRYLLNIAKAGIRHLDKSEQKAAREQVAALSSEKSAAKVFNALKKLTVFDDEASLYRDTLNEAASSAEINLKKALKAFSAMASAYGMEDDDALKKARAELNAIRPGLATRALNVINDGGDEQDFLKKLRPILEGVKDVWILGLRQGGKVKGYYVSDDQELTKKPEKAWRYKSKKEAEDDAAINNRQWLLKPGQRFVPIDTTIVEANFQKTHRLVDKDGKVLKVGDKVKDFRGEEHTIKDWAPGHHEGSSGRVYTDRGAYYPSVVDAKVVPAEEVSEEIIDEAQKLIKTIHSPDGKRMAKVYRDRDWDEFIVKFYANGEHQEEADYHTDDRTDAEGTAAHEMGVKDAVTTEALRSVKDIADDEEYATTKSNRNDTVFIHDRVKSDADKARAKKNYPHDTVIFMKGSQIKKLKRIMHTTNVFDESVYTNYADWKQIIKLSFPAHAKDIKFRAKMEGEKTTIIASAGDRVFGEWDESIEEGKVLSERNNG